MSLSLSERIQTGRIDRPDEWTMDGYSWEAKKLENKIAELENQWISVEDRLPAYGDSVLLVGNGVVQKVTYSLDGADDVPDWFEPYYFDSDVGCSIPWNKPTHWMPLPKPPKEQGE